MHLPFWRIENSLLDGKYENLDSKREIRGEYKQLTCLELNTQNRLVDDFLR